MSRGASRREGLCFGYAPAIGTKRRPVFKKKERGLEQVEIHRTQAHEKNEKQAIGVRGLLVAKHKASLREGGLEVFEACLEGRMSCLVVALVACTAELGDGIDHVVLEHTHQGVVVLALWEQLGRTFPRPDSSRLQSALEPRSAHTGVAVLRPLRRPFADGDKMLYEALFG